MPLSGQKLKEYREKWYKEHKDVIVKRASEWRKANKKRRAEISKKWAELNHPDEERRKRAKVFYGRQKRKSSSVKEFKKEIAKLHELEYKRNFRFRKFDIDFDLMIKKQENKCAICFVEAKFDIDHCHKTNKVRGLLCRKCNLALGLFKDNVQILQNAVQYINGSTPSPPHKT